MKHKLVSQLEFWLNMEIDQGALRLVVVYLLLTCAELPF